MWEIKEAHWMLWINTGCYGLIQGVIKITPCGFGVRQLACIKAFIEAIGRWSGDVENAWYIEWY